MFLRLLVLSAVACIASAAELTLKSPKVSISSTKGGDAETISLSLDKPLSTPIELSNTESLRLSFALVKKGTDTGVQPHQAFLRLFDPETEEEGIVPLRVSSAGKVKFDLNMAKLPSSMPPSGPNPLKVSLIVGSYEHSSAKWNLFDLQIPESQPAPEHPEQHLWRSLPEIEHTFRPDQVLPEKTVSAIFTLVVLWPWVALLMMLKEVPNPLPNLISSSVLPFVLLLAAFEGLLFKYWVGMKLGEVLLYGAILGLPTLAAGKHALTTLSHKRLGTKA